MNKVRLTPEAARDLAGIQEYIAIELQNRSAAKRTVKRISNELRILERYALAGPSIEALTGFETELRMLVCGNHIAVYRVEGQVVSIARVFNARLDYLRVLFGDAEESAAANEDRE